MQEWTSLLKLGALTIVNLIAYHYASGNQMPGFFLAGTILYWMRCAERLFHSWRGRPRMVPAGEDKRYVGFIIASGLCCLLFFRA